MATLDSKGLQMQPIGEPSMSSPDVESPSNNSNQDEAVLAFWGKKQQLKRRFGIISIVGLTCCLMITWEGILIVMGNGLINGGPLGLICAFIFAWLGVSAQVLVMAELGSMMPIAGGQYNWVANLAPPSISRFLSYVTGWITTIAWQSVTASGVYLVATLVQGLIILVKPDFNATRWQSTLMFYAVILIALFVNTVLIRILPQIESGILFIHVFGFIGILVPLAYLGPKASAHDVFQTFLSEGGWDTKGLTFFVGLNTTMLVLIGIDGATHMAEEIENASSVIPKAMIISVLVNGVTGLAILIAALFSIADLDAVVNTPTKYPFMEIFHQAVGSTGGAAGMTALILLAMIFATIGVLATAPRMLWAFARERGLPGHSWISKVEPRTALPLVAIGTTVVINMLLTLINLGSSTAFNAFVSLTVSSFYISFILSACCSLWRRFSKEPLHYGPFQLGRFAIPVTIYAICYSLIGAFFAFWPPVIDPGAAEMNWAVVVFAGVIVASLAHWFLQARHEYVGPRIEVPASRLGWIDESRVVP